MEAEIKSQWKSYKRDDEIVCDILGLDCLIWISRRPAYCDRGNFLAHIEVNVGGNALRLDLDYQDGWPHYYMDLERAKVEIEDWMKKRKQWIE